MIEELIKLFVSERIEKRKRRRKDSEIVGELSTKSKCFCMFPVNIL